MKRKTHHKHVRETNAGKAISAYVILNKKREVVAYVSVFHTTTINGHQKWVDVYQPKDPSENKFTQYVGRTLNEALHGAVIDGVTLYDDSSDDEASKKILDKYLNAKNEEERNKLMQKAFKAGMIFTNWRKHGWTALYYLGGMDRLKNFGYEVIQAF